MDVLEAKHDLCGVERSQILWNLLEVVEDLEHIAALHVLHEQVDDPLVLSHALHLQNQWVVQLSHEQDLIADVPLVLLLERTILGLKLDSKEFLLGRILVLLSSLRD